MENQKPSLPQDQHPRVWRLPTEAKKLRSPSRCKQCGVLYQDGRWSWHIHGITEPVLSTLCPACQLVNKHQATGFLTLSGNYFLTHKDDILNLIHRIANYECEQHPLNRLIAVDKRGNGIRIRFTDRHLPKQIGHAIKQAHAGELRINYDETLCRVSWQRP